jgi:cobalamin 5'-phosphate synthase/cobalamin synthase
MTPGADAPTPPPDPEHGAPLLRAWRDFGSALRFLTVIPVPGGRRLAAAVGPSRATAFFPVVGCLVGAILLALRGILPVDGLLAPVLVLAAWTALPGGLHEDGWADCADAALPPVSRARRLEILQDPRVGAHGLVAVVLLLLVRLAGIVDAPAWALLVAPVVGRWAMVVSLAYARPLRERGLGAALARGARPGLASATAAVWLVAMVVTISWWHGGSHADAVTPSGLAAAPSPGLSAASSPGLSAVSSSSLSAVSSPGLSEGSAQSGWAGAAPPVAMAVAAALAIAALAGWGVAAFLQRRFGGLSGDGHGAVGLAAETGALCLLAIWPLAGPIGGAA